MLHLHVNNLVIINLDVVLHATLLQCSHATLQFWLTSCLNDLRRLGQCYTGPFLIQHFKTLRMLWEIQHSLKQAVSWWWQQHFNENVELQYSWKERNMFHGIYRKILARRSWIAQANFPMNIAMLHCNIAMYIYIMYQAKEHLIWLRKL